MRLLLPVALTAEEVLSITVGDIMIDFTIQVPITRDPANRPYINLWVVLV